MKYISELHVKLNGKELQWVGNVNIDFGNEVNIVYPFSPLPYTHDGLNDMTQEERDVYVNKMAQDIITANQENINLIEDAVSKRFYGVFEEEVV